MAVDDALDAEALDVARSPRRRGAAVARGGAVGDGPGDRVLRGVPPARRRARSTSPRSPRRRRATSTSVIRPVVTVPVLSSTTVSTRRVDSSTSGPLMRMPSWAPRPVPTISAVGVARPRAHGQAMISTATAAVNAPVGRRRCRARSRAWRRPGRSRRARRPPRPGRRAAGPAALPFWASSTSRAICASGVSAPTRVARTTRRPPALTVAPATASPGPTSTGTDSPVSMRRVDRRACPPRRSPSVAIFSPGRTTKRSPTASCSIGTRTSTPSRRTATSLAPSSSSARSAAPARRLARASK